MEKRSAYVIIAVFIICLLILVLFISDEYNKNDISAKDDSGNNVYVTPSPEPVEQAVFSGYYLIDENGELVVYQHDMDTIYERTGIRTEMLEPEEQDKLKNGYHVNDEEELYALLESYSS